MDYVEQGFYSRLVMWERNIALDVGKEYNLTVVETFLKNTIGGCCNLNLKSVQVCSKAPI